MSYDKVIIIGNITRQPELKYTPSGVAVCEFGIAINKKRKGEDKVCFLDIVSFNKTAEFVQKYFSKGSEILVEGEHDQDIWDDKDTGKKRSKIKIIANQVNFVGKKADNPQSGNSEYNQSRPPINNEYNQSQQSDSNQGGQDQFRKADQFPQNNGEFPANTNGDSEDDIPF
jgi:single-strand DNA-binding protein